MPKKIIRTDKEINKVIKNLVKDSSNFTYDNYGSEAADNGQFEVSFDKNASERTLRMFVKWLTEK